MDPRLLASLLPAAAVAVEAFEDDPSAVLFPEEAALLSRAVDKRRREFTTARVCAHRALEGLGLPAAPILPGSRGAPGWPDGVVGSITHCAGYRAAAVARAAEVHTIGIDAEPNEPTPGGVLKEITVPAEEGWLAALTRTRPAVCWDRLLFSAKESVYKAWYPLAERWLGFGDAALVIHPGTAPMGPPAPGPAARGTFTAKLLVAGPRLAGGELTGFDGRWLSARGLLVTAITVPHLDGTPVTTASPQTHPAYPEG